MNGKVLPLSGDFFSYTRREPVGVVGQIIPVNKVFKSISDEHFALFSVELSNGPTHLENRSIYSNWLHNNC